MTVKAGKRELEKRRKLFIKYRKDLGPVSQRELARALEYSSGTVISHKETGYREVTVRDLFSLECLLRREGKWKKGSECIKHAKLTGETMRHLAPYRKP